MEGDYQSLEGALIQEELRNIHAVPQATLKWCEQTSKPSIFTNYQSTSIESDRYIDHNKHRFNHYADKQLKHLVVAQQFDFNKIAQLLNYIFRDERIRYTETACRERWEELHLLRELGENVEEKRMENKRATSVSTFSDPFSLYNLQEMLDKLHKNQIEHHEQQRQRRGDPAYGGSGYNIFKNSIRRIDDMELYRKRQSEMMYALNLAQDPQHVITDKLMHFSPYYSRLNEFEVKAEELTEQKMKEIMSVPIEIQKMQFELRIKDMNQLNEGYKLKRIKKEEPVFEKEAKYEIEDNWDDYESD